ncbi:MAG TPA: nicotinamide riboside transporter PnuC [Bacteroidia bacterium]|nr:nicotinamide riboside transporter PnuC [Bacteroidia bacterium]
MSWPDLESVIMQTIRETSLVLWAAFFLLVLYIFLAAKENIFCWPVGIAGSILSVAVYFSENYPFEAWLNICYALLGFYGWFEWQKGRKKNVEVDSGPSDKPIVNMRPKHLVIALFCGAAGALFLGFIGSEITASAKPWADASIASFSLLATWMTAKKYIENWLFWIVTNAGAAVLYFATGPRMYVFALLFLLYTFMSVAGYFSWRIIQKRSGA